MSIWIWIAIVLVAWGLGIVLIGRGLGRLDSSRAREDVARRRRGL